MLKVLYKSLVIIKVVFGSYNKPNQRYVIDTWAEVGSFFCIQNSENIPYAWNLGCSAKISENCFPLINVPAAQRAQFSGATVLAVQTKQKRLGETILTHGHCFIF